MMTRKQRLAKEYAILKHAVWAEDGVITKNNSQECHYKRAMKFKTIPELIIQNDRLIHKLCEVFYAGKKK